MEDKEEDNFDLSKCIRGCPAFTDADVSIAHAFHDLHDSRKAAEDIIGEAVKDNKGLEESIAEVSENREISTNDCSEKK